MESFSGVVFLLSLEYFSSYVLETERDRMRKYLWSVYTFLDDIDCTDIENLFNVRSSQGLKSRLHFTLRS